MKAISLRQPWASLWVRGVKIHETRRYRIHARGWILVHAAKSMSECSAAVVELATLNFGTNWANTEPSGAILGAVFVTRCEPSGLTRQIADADDLACGDFSPGRWAWRTEDRVRFATPIPYRGMMGLFPVPEALIVERAALAWSYMNSLP